MAKPGTVFSMPKSLEFKTLPLVEAAVRISFSTPKVLTYSLLDSIFTAIKSTFHAIGEPKQYEVPPGTGGQELQITPGYLPGAVYTGHPANVSVSVQPQVIVVRWARLPGLNSPNYPRFAELRQSLWSAHEAFKQACGDEYPGISVVNMSYVNFVPAERANRFLTTYFSPEAQLPLLTQALEVRKLEAAWREDGDVDLRFAVEQATARLPAGVTDGYRLTTAAGLRLTESVDAKSGLDRLHDRLQDFFVQLISNAAKSEWGLKE